MFCLFCYTWIYLKPRKYYNFGTKNILDVPCSSFQRKSLMVSLRWLWRFTEKTRISYFFFLNLYLIKNQIRRVDVGNRFTAFDFSTLPVTVGLGRILERLDCRSNFPKKRKWNHFHYIYLEVHLSGIFPEKYVFPDK